MGEQVRGHQVQQPFPFAHRPRLATGENVVRDLATLPKAHLHLHLEGAMRPETLAEFAREAGEAVPPVRGYTTFPEFVQMYDGAVSFVRTREQLARVSARSCRTPPRPVRCGSRRRPTRCSTSRSSARRRR